MRILFVLKERFYSNDAKKSYGLMNSAKQVAEYLETLGHDCKLVQVIDGNFIDHEVYEYKPQVVIIEALWVTGAKLKELMEIKRYKHIKWIVRVHSDIGFLAAETWAMKYINEYIELRKDNLFLSMNNYEFNKNISDAINYNFVYLPNIITIEHNPFDRRKKIKNHIDIGCFGSLRIMKNQCYQALCAMEMADSMNKILKFHITVDIGMSEQNSRYPVLKNLEEIFKDSRHELVKHHWLENEDFHRLIRHMDVGMQLSYTESFNIVSADFVNENVPIVVSDAIDWMPFILKTSTTKYKRTIRKLKHVYWFRRSWLLNKWMKFNLITYNTTAKLKWRTFINHI